MTLVWVWSLKKKLFAGTDRFTRNFPFLAARSAVDDTHKFAHAKVHFTLNVQHGVVKNAGGDDRIVKSDYANSISAAACVLEWLLLSGGKLLQRRRLS
jgi:hypothetical protein